MTTLIHKDIQKRLLPTSFIILQKISSTAPFLLFFTVTDLFVDGQEMLKSQ